MKRVALIRHPVKQGCELIREGGNHSWWGCLATKRRSAVPRHREVNDLLVTKICKDLGISEP